MTEAAEHIPEQSWTMRDYVRILFRQKWMIILCCLVVTSIAVAGLMLQTRQFEAQVKMLVSSEKQVAVPYYKDLYSGQPNSAALTQIEIVTSNPVLERTVQTLRLYEKPIDYEYKFASPLKRRMIRAQAKMFMAQMQQVPMAEQRMLNYRRAVEELRKSIKVEPVKDTNVFVIKVKDFDRIGAAVIANVVSRAYVIFDLEQQLAELKMKYGSKHPLVMQMQDNIDNMTKNLSGKPLPSTESIGPASVKIIEQASLPLASIAKPKALIVAVAFFMGLLLGLILAFVFEFMDQTVKFSNRTEENLQVPFLGSIPRIRRRKRMTIFTDKVRLPVKFTSAFTALGDQIRLLMANKNFKTVLIAGCNLREGTSTTAANVALALAEHAGKKVLLIDANLRQPTLHKMFNIVPASGLAEALSGDKGLVVTLSPIKHNLSLLPGGTTNLNPTTLLDSPRMRKLMEDLKAQFDAIIIDCPPLNTCREGFILSSMADKMLVVIAENRTRKQVILRNLSSLRNLKVDLMGAVLNFRTYPIPRFLYTRV